MVPAPPPELAGEKPIHGKLVARPICGGLHHDYGTAAYTGIANSADRCCCPLEVCPICRNRLQAALQMVRSLLGPLIAIAVSTGFNNVILIERAADEFLRTTPCSEMEAQQ